MTKLNSIQKKILKTAVAHAKTYGVDQPITVLSEKSMVHVDELLAAQRKYFKAMNELVVNGVIDRNTDGFAYITDYNKVLKVISV